MSQHLSLRVDNDVLGRLDAQSRRSGRSRSWVARRLLEEGLRMEQHPGIVFRSGPAGRRAGLMGGPDVWEVVRAVRGGAETRETAETRESIAERVGVTPELLGATLGYYAEYRDEIEEWVRRIDEEAERAEAAWRGEQELLGR